MSSKSDQPVAAERSPTGLLSQLNWQKANEGQSASGTTEYAFYSDAHITGEFIDGLGPYSFLNTVPIPDKFNVNTPIVLRASIHLDEYRPDMSKTDETLYHGGTLIDELAALTSLCLGARIRAGGESRVFEPGKDPLGRPIAWHDRPKPIVNVRSNRPNLPSVGGTHALEELEPLKTIPALDTKPALSENSLLTQCVLPGAVRRHEFFVTSVLRWHDA